jgi:SPP1 family predicted phage head-tail adaptor
VRAGSLRSLIRIERPVIGADPYGDPQVRTWVKVVETFASKRVSSGSEAERYDQRVSNYDVEWRLRYRGTFDPRWRIVEVVTGTVHDIIFAADPDGKRREILCRTRIDAPQPNTEAVP